MNTLLYTKALESHAGSIQVAAQASWRKTYAAIFDEAFIERFLARNYSLESLIRAINSTHSTFLVACDQDQVLGFCQFGPPITDDCKDRDELYRLYVHPDHWRSGIGAGLLAMMESQILAGGLHEVFCYVHSRNRIGAGFYLKNGFLHDSSRDKDEEWYMVKALA